VEGEGGLTRISAAQGFRFVMQSGNCALSLRQMQANTGDSQRMQGADGCDRGAMSAVPCSRESCGGRGGKLELMDAQLERGPNEQGLQVSERPRRRA
jgi:hypothetical protein